MTHVKMMSIGSSFSLVEVPVGATPHPCTTSTYWYDTTQGTQTGQARCWVYVSVCRVRRHYGRISIEMPHRWDIPVTPEDLHQSRSTFSSKLLIFGYSNVHYSWTHDKRCQQVRLVSALQLGHGLFTHIGLRIKEVSLCEGGHSHAFGPSCVLIGLLEPRLGSLVTVSISVQQESIGKIDCSTVSSQLVR